jgi:hypothetical protein
MLMAGNAQYSQIEGYREINCDTAKDAHDLDFEELKFHKEGEDIYLLGKLKSVKDFYKSDELSPDDLFYLVIHSGKYKKYSPEEKKQVECDPSYYENTVREYLNSENGQKLFEIVSKGTISINPNIQMLDLIKSGGNWNVLFSQFSIVESPQFVKDFAIKAKRGYGGGAKAQTEMEKLKDRVTFLLEQSGLSDCKNLLDFVVLQGEISEEQEKAIVLAKELMGLN